MCIMLDFLCPKVENQLARIGTTEASAAAVGASPSTAAACCTNQSHRTCCLFAFYLLSGRSIRRRRCSRRLSVCTHFKINPSLSTVEEQLNETDLGSRQRQFPQQRSQLRHVQVSKPVWESLRWTTAGAFKSVFRGPFKVIHRPIWRSFTCKFYDRSENVGFFWKQFRLIKFFVS